MKTSKYGFRINELSKINFKSKAKYIFCVLFSSFFLNSASAALLDANLTPACSPTRWSSSVECVSFNSHYTYGVGSYFGGVTYEVGPGQALLRKTSNERVTFNAGTASQSTRIGFANQILGVVSLETAQQLAAKTSGNANRLQGPSETEVDTINFFIGTIRSWLAPTNPVIISPNSDTNSHGANGVRGSNNEIPGWIIGTASPGFVIGEIDIPADISSLYFSFSPTSIGGPDDSLDISLNGQSIFSDNLINYVIGNLYEFIFDIPNEFLGQTAIFDYQLSNPSGEFSEIFVSEFGVHSSEIESVSEPSIIALFAAGLFGLGFARRRKLRQS